MFLCPENIFPGQDPLTKDVFPLSIGNSWKYSYRFSDDDVGNMDGSEQLDSGTVSFVIVDSVSDNDTIFWTVQNRSAITRTIKLIQALVVYRETTYAVVDSSTFTLSESKTGNHPLIISGQFSFSTLWPLYSSSCDTSIICRYQTVDPSKDTNTVKIKICDSPNSHYMIYQLKLVARSGLISNTASGVLGFHSHSSASISSQLLEKNVLLYFLPKAEPFVPGTIPILFQNFPNPFNPATTLRYMIPTKSLVSLNVYNVLGQEVKNFGSSVLEAGYYELDFDASTFPSGAYFYQIQSLDLQNRDRQFVASKRMLFIK
jgi:hypothetical protein